ncbi:hypothetical protein [Pseudoduganella sp. OTU4001]|uniref:hypothetical protein n=1 Tax=Pseudoduganella sp. OTU4001 TaxID=3043854 RepID=UPI00313BBE11
MLELSGRFITRWVGMEMALSDGVLGEGPVQWEDESIPYLQLVSIDIQLDDDTSYRLLAQLDDGSGHYGLYLIARDKIEEPSACEVGSIFRTRDLNELPVGMASIAIEQADGPNAVLRIEIRIESQSILCWAAEVYEENDGTFRIAERDESILLQIDGVRPNHKFQRTPTGAAEH